MSYGFVHYWLLEVRKRLREFGGAAAVVYIEDDCRLQRPINDVIDVLQVSSKPLVWLGYDHKPSRHGKYQIGSTMIGFRGTGLQDALQVALLDRPKRPQSKVWRHLDLLLWDDLEEQID